ncbi:MAG: Nramp family divalent metal transporter [Methanosarcinaceae archaeon]|nr:Nramp family divalent metal transporter [Methanosarcinaceae archaeon]
MILAVHMSVDSYPDLLSSGAASRYRMLWVIAVALIYKYCLTEGLSRYTIARGEDIFRGFRNVPGPRNWEVIFIMSIYTLELLGFGGIAFFAGTSLIRFLPGPVSSEMVSIGTILLAVLFLYKSSYSLFEKIVSLCAVLILLGTLYTLLGTGIPLGNVSEGFVPSLKKEELVTVMGLLGAAGSSLSLLLYSSWLKEKIGDKHGEEYFTRHFRYVRLSQGLAFGLTGLFSFAFMTIGLFSGSDIDFLAGISLALARVPHGVEVFFFTSYTVFVALILTGVDGRIRAIASILSSTGISSRPEMTLYRWIISFFVAVIFLILNFGNPIGILTWVSALASIMFAFIGFMVVYLDFTLPQYARGSALWRLLMVAGSFLFLFVALLKEEKFLLFGVPLMERVTVVAFIIYLFSGSKSIRKALKKGFSIGDKALIVMVFGTLSIYGTAQAVLFDGALINFRDLGPMIAGLIGGPFIGGFTGLIGGLYRYSQGGWTALPCAIATVLAGALAGYVSLYWKGRLDYFRLILLGAFVEAFHLLIILPLLVYPAPFEDVFAVIRSCLLPMILTNAFGLSLFLYIMNEQGFSLENHFSSGGQDGGVFKFSVKALIVPFSVFAFLIFEKSFLEIGIQLIERFVVVAFFLYFLSSTGLTKRALKGSLSLRERVGLVLGFGLLSIYGTLQGVRVDGLLVNFRDLGPLLAGLTCGPFAGVIAGFMGGLVRYSQGGWTALPCAVASVAAGLIGGYASRQWGGKPSYSRLISLGFSVEALHIFVLIPLLLYPLPLEKLLEVAHNTFLPMVITNVLGLLIFLYVNLETNIPEGETDFAPDKDKDSYAARPGSATAFRDSYAARPNSDTEHLIKPLGAAVLVFLAVTNDASLLNVVIPLLERVLVFAFSLYLFSRTESFRAAVESNLSASSRIWLVMGFGLLSIYGTMRAIPVDDIFINFRDLGPMIAGLLGGPVLGGLAGIFGGMYRYSQGGWTAVPCVFATIVAGIISGGFSNYWKKKFSQSKLLFLGILVECLHILVIFPLMVYPAPPDDILGVIRISLLPMILVNALGLLLFLYIMKERGFDFEKPERRPEK